MYFNLMITVKCLSYVMNYYPNLFAFYRRDGKFSLIIIVPSELGRYNYINGFAEFLLTARGLREAVDAVSRALQFFILLHVHPFFFFWIKVL